MAARKPTIIGHFDGILKLNEGNKYFDETADWYKALALEALHAVDPKASLLEINTGSKTRSAPYPAKFLLEEWRAMGGRIIITADAHTPEGILAKYQNAVDLAKSAGFAHSVLLTSSGITECPL